VYNFFKKKKLHNGNKQKLLCGSSADRIIY